MSVVKRPVAVNRIQKAFEAVCASQKRQSCQVVGQYLESSNKALSVNHLNAELSSSTRTELQKANRRGLEEESSYVLSGQARWQAADWLALNVGMQIDEDDITPEDTYISLGSDWAQLDVGYRPHWFSPFNQSAMIMSTQAETMATVSLSNSRPLSFLNFSYELFVGEMSGSDRIQYQGSYTSGKPILTGMHFEISPFQGFSLSANRIMQSGGGERGGRSLSDLFKAFVDPSGSDNTSEDLSHDEQFGNQAASLVSRFNFAGRKPFSIYLEYAGEDTSRGSNWRLGNVSMSAGVDIPNLFLGLSLQYEYSHWQNAWYVHGVYNDGLTNSSNIIGHWAAELRDRSNSIAGDGVGARHHYLNLSWLNHDALWQLEYSQTKNQDYSQFDYETAQYLNLSWFGQTFGVPLNLSFATGKNTLGEKSTSATIGVNW